MRNNRNPEPAGAGWQYELKLMNTAAATGYFACEPLEEPTDDEAIAYLRVCPNDEFMRRYLIRRLNTLGAERMEALIRQTPDTDTFLLAVLYETCLFTGAFQPFLPAFGRLDLRRLADQSPLPYLRSLASPRHRLHREWSLRAAANILRQEPVFWRETPETEFPYSPGELAAVPEETLSLEGFVAARNPEAAGKPYRARTPAETAGKALEKLEAAGILADIEKRHQSSLSPIGLLRQWRMNVRIAEGRHNIRLGGLQTAYGRGFDLESARASYAMEIVERYSAFAGVHGGKLTGYRKEHALTFGRLSDLRGGATEPLDPNHLLLEAPYENEPLYWIRGELKSERGERDVLVPVQAVALFSNLDEVALFSGRGSTGLAAGNTMEEAKVAGLLEMVERYSEAVMPFQVRQCFTLESRDEALAGLLGAYAQAGIQVQFQDLTTAMGIPCCKCFVRGLNGDIVKGTGAHLNARRALLSAMTETPFPFPHGGPSGPSYSGLFRVPFENLPDYSSGDAGNDLALLETVLIRNGFEVVYVDLSRSDMDFPVVRALVPAMEINGDLDRFTRVHPNFIRNYRRAAGG
ncbi:MAG: YcaO-like family protein [Thermodesulfobacteriota bacterium]